MKFFILIIASFLFLLHLCINAQNKNISGIINQYAEGINKLNNTQVKISNVSFLAPGDTVLIYQAKGAFINLSNDQTFGNITHLGNAGLYEFSIVETIDIQQNIVTFSCPLLNNYDDSLFQVIKVPNFKNATVTATLTCAPWDGKKGGVLVFFVHDTLILNADINVNNKGFRGAISPVMNTLVKCSNEANIYNYYYTYHGHDSAGLKGESICVLPSTYARGMGKNANGGGGGNGINSGGGGGGNGGMGGNGGRETYMCPLSGNYGGRGGVKIFLNQSINGSRIFFGGGGGTGTFEQLPNDVAPGGNGGGIVIVLAKTIIANNHSIKANGENVMYVTQYESAGGGGGGGTIILSSININGNLSLYASGGNGGSSSLSSCRGSGGGGGGGVVYYASMNSTPIVDVSKGNAGNACNGYVGTNGENGSISTVFQLNFGCLLSQNQIYANQQICPGFQPHMLTGTTSPLFYSYLWQYSTDFSTWHVCPGTNNQPDYQPPVLTQTTYYRRLVFLLSGTSIDTSNIVTITVAPLQANYAVSHVTCYGANNGQIQTTVNGGSPPYSFFWSNGSTYQNLINVPAGTYILNITDSKGCSRWDTILIVQPQQMIVNISKQDVICYGNSNGSAFASVSGGTSPYTYHWSNGSNQSYITNLQAGIYYLTVNDYYNCQIISSVNINQPSALNVSTSITHPSCEYSCNGSILLSITGGTPPYQITPSSLSNLCQGTYTILVNDTNNCSLTTTAILVPQTTIQNNVIQYNTASPACYQTVVTLTGSNPTGSGLFNFLWQTSIDGVNWTNAIPPNYHPNYQWYVDQSRYFRRIVTGGGCYDTSNVLLINAIKLNNVIQTADTFYCTYDNVLPITGNVNSGYIYTWQINTGSGWITLPDQTPDILPYNQYNMASYRRIVHGSGCVDTSNVITIYFINSSGGALILINDSVTYKQYCIMATGNITGQVSLPNIMVQWQMSQDSINWITLPDTTLSYSYYLTDYSNRYYYYRRIITFQGCADTSNVVTIELLPPLLNIIETNQGLSSTVEICSGQMLAIGSFINQPAGGNNQFDYIWIYHTNNTSWTYAPGVYNQKNYLTPVIWDTTYFARIIISGACIDTSNIITVIPIILPPNEIQTAQTAYCFGQTVQSIEEQISTLGHNVSYQWQMLSNGSWVDISGANQSTYLPDYIIGSTKYRRNIFKGNCSLTSNEITIMCSPATSASIELLSNDSLCKLSNSVANIHVQINGNPPWSISYSVNGNISVYTQHQSDSIIYVSLQQNFYEIYFVQITDNNNCVVQIPSDTLRIWAFNPVNAQSLSLEICGLTATLQAQPPVEGIGKWILPPNLTCNNVHQHNAQVFSTLYGTFPIVWEVTNGPCIDTNQTTITFYEQPVQPYAGADLTLYDANTFVVMNASMPTAGIGTWTVIYGQATFSDEHNPSTQVSGLAEGDNLLRWTISNGVCNSVYDDVLIRLISIVVPEGFSPNGDGKNDYFEIKGIDVDIAYQLMIFNRWGNVVYESKQYQNNWNGKDNQGKDLPDDTYFFMLSKDNKLLKSGYLILKR